jgi:DNA-binding response OmpR family regulator
MTEEIVSMSVPEFSRRQVRVGSRVIQLGFQEHKLVVALLKRHPEHWTQAKELIDEMWGWSILPDAWHKIIHAYCYQLRRRGVPIEGRRGRANGGLRIYRRGRIALVDRVS